jgi:hypothetical protein
LSESISPNSQYLFCLLYNLIATFPNGPPSSAAINDGLISFSVIKEGKKDKVKEKLVGESENIKFEGHAVDSLHR